MKKSIILHKAVMHVTILIEATPLLDKSVILEKIIVHLTRGGGTEV